jgi:hypothetical protein
MAKAHRMPQTGRIYDCNRVPFRSTEFLLLLHTGGVHIRFDEGVLGLFARLDVVPRHPPSCPTQHRTTSQFGSVVRQEAVMADD